MYNVKKKKNKKANNDPQNTTQVLRKDRRMFVPKVFATKSLSFSSNNSKVRPGIKEIIQTIVIVINIKEKR
jgi:hypothetical protein